MTKPPFLPYRFEKVVLLFDIKKKTEEYGFLGLFYEMI